MFTSLFRRLARRMFPIDVHAARGEPRPIVRKGREAGVWLGYALDGTPTAYFVGCGASLLRPVAICFGSRLGGELSPADFRHAKAIAAKWELASNETENRFDLRDCTHRDDLLNLVLFATDRKGHARYDGEHYGTMFLSDGRIWTALAPEAVPWMGTNRRHPADPIPSFEMQIDDWHPVPEALKNHLDEIDPKPNKNSVQIAVNAPSPGKSESDRAATLNAA